MQAHDDCERADRTEENSRTWFLITDEGMEYHPPGGSRWPFDENDQLKSSG